MLFFLNERNNPRVKWVDIVYMARCAAAGVMHLHKENIIHRDLAARNLLLDGKLAGRHYPPPSHNPTELFL